MKVKDGISRVKKSKISQKENTSYQAKGFKDVIQEREHKVLKEVLWDDKNHV